MSLTPADKLARLKEIQGDQLTVSQLAFVCGVTVNTIRNHIDAGILPAHRIGRQWVINRPDAINYLDYRPDYRPRTGKWARAKGRQAGESLTAQ